MPRKRLKRQLNDGLVEFTANGSTEGTNEKIAVLGKF